MSSGGAGMSGMLFSRHSPSAPGCLGESVLLFNPISLEINLWPAGSLIESTWTESGFTLLWGRDIFSFDLERHVGNDGHISDPPKWR